MKRVQHLLAVAGLLVAAFGSATTWWVANLSTGARVEVSGTGASAVLWSVGAVVVAAYGLQFTLRGYVRRSAAGLQAVSSTTFAGIAVGLASNPLASAAEGITAVTGVAGSNALLLVESVDLTLWHLSAVLAGLLLAVSGILGALARDRVATPDRFDRNSHPGSLEDSVSAWDSLSDGTDPTQR